MQDTPLGHQANITAEFQKPPTRRKYLKSERENHASEQFSSMFTINIMIGKAVFDVVMKSLHSDLCFCGTYGVFFRKSYHGT